MPESQLLNITRVEATERARHLFVRSYDVTLDLTRGTEMFESTTVITFDCSTPGAATFVDVIAETVHRIELNGTALDPGHVFDGARIQLTDLAAKNVVRVVADCRYMNTGEGLHRFVDPVDGEVYLYSQFEVADSRRVFTVFEQPDLKASFAFTVTAPDHWTVVSNQPTPLPQPADRGKATWSFEPTPRLSSYVTAIIAGPYHGEHRELRSRDGRSIPLGVYCRKSLAEHLDTDELVEITRQGFEYYEQIFDLPYPFTKYDQLFVPEFNAGAMENAGAVTFLERYVFRSRVSEAMVERRALTVLHELAHMWFGDLVTMRWWDDLWLNESFAEWASTSAQAANTRWPWAWTTFNIAEKSWAYRQDQLATTHPIVADIRDLEDVEVNFDGITYAKGASVLKQLVAYVGEEHFIAGIREYFRHHAWGNTELSDLLRELEKASGRDLREWSALWLEQAGVTTLTPTLSTAEDGTLTDVSITQTAPDEYPTLRPHRIAVGNYTVTDGQLQRTHRVEIDVTGEDTAVPHLIGQPQPDLLLVNDDDLGYSKIRLDAQSLRTAVAHLDSFTDSMPRSIVLGAVWDMTRDAESAASDFVTVALRALGTETNSTQLALLLAQVSTTTRLYSHPTNRNRLQDKVTSTVHRLAKDAAPGSDRQLQLTIALAGSADHAEEVSAIRGLFDGTMVWNGLAIDDDMRWTLLTSLVAAGAADETAIAAELARDATATGERSAALARAAVPTARAKDAVWRSVIDGDSLPNAVQEAMIAGFTRVLDPELLRPYVSRYFAAIENIWATRTNEIAQQIVTGLYPMPLADAALLGSTDAWLDQHPQAPAALRRLVTENRDALARALRAQAVDHQ
ncbi:MAG: aminopeptidase N [Actinomycetota bacterium]